MTGDLPPLPPRPGDGHKGTFGTVCVLGGQAAAPQVMLGGPALAAIAALRTGAGLAVLAVPQPLLHAALSVAPSATGLALPVDRHGRLQPSEVAELLDQYLPQYECLAAGPGFGADEPQRRIMVRLITRADLPMVIDADALNALSHIAEIQRDFRAQAVLTPHPGEYKRLAAALRIEADPVDRAARPAAAQELARRVGCVVVLKGPGTVVSDGINAWTNTTGNVALATGGSGDVLTGVIAALVAQQVAGPSPQEPSLYDCARLGVHLHGLAADRWASAHGVAGMLATDLLQEIPDAMAALRAEEGTRDEG
ncbi:MAG: NAD(P)H-hydrate dehydratase [Phycisphaerales bacterium]